jgi:hypothetical protein
MRFRFPSRAKRKPTKSSDSRWDSALSDVLWTSTRALQESGDAFPPLKSAVGGVVALCEIAGVGKYVFFKRLTLMACVPHTACKARQGRRARRCTADQGDPRCHRRRSPQRLGNLPVDAAEY